MNKDERPKIYKNQDMDKVDKRTLIYREYKEYLKSQEDSKELERLNKENIEIEEKLKIINNNEKYEPSDKELRFLRDMEKKMNSVTGPYPDITEVRKRKELLGKIGD